MDSTELQILRRARELISDPDRWCQGAGGMNGADERVGYWHPHACRWCAWGAICRAAEEIVRHLGQAGIAARRAAARLMPAVCDAGAAALMVINDEQGHAAVLALFDKALSEKEATP